MRKITVNKKPCTLKNVPIEFEDNLVPGMLIANKKKLEDVYTIVFSKQFRDPLVLCLDDYGHTKLVPAWDGNYVIVPGGCEKVRIAYGKTPDGDIEVAKDYYYSETDFRERHPEKRFWYVEELMGTIKFIAEKDPRSPL